MPVPSASAMKSPGGMLPRSGWFQRSSASTPIEAFVVEGVLRLVVQRELVVGLEGAAQVAEDA